MENTAQSIGLFCEVKACWAHLLRNYYSYTKTVASDSQLLKNLGNDLGKDTYLHIHTYCLLLYA